VSPPAPARPFEIVCEIEPAVRPELMRVRHQIGVLSRVASAFLIPDNHLGRATVSSVACAHEVEAMGGRSIACLNARDRNLLGLRRDLLTAAAYGVDQFLLVHGDRPTAGERTSQLTVRKMMAEVREFGGSEVFAGCPPFRVGLTARAGGLVPWKREADFLFVQVSFSAPRLAAWRASVDFAGPVYAGVMVLASAPMARRLAASVSEIEIPAPLIDALERDPAAGVARACELVAEIEASGAFAGVHLVPVGRYREVAARLEAAGYARRRSARPGASPGIPGLR
jgi:5,10-methylenetetrahydrofolate reductase